MKLFTSRTVKLLSAERRQPRALAITLEQLLEESDAAAASTQVLPSGADGLSRVGAFRNLLHAHLDIQNRLNSRPGSPLAASRAAFSSSKLPVTTSCPSACTDTESSLTFTDPGDLQVRPMALKDYVRQCSLRFSKNETLITPAEDLALYQLIGHKGSGTYLDYEGAVLPPTGDVEDVPFYGRYAKG